jgi:putative CocE/NonD family hydrolase
MLLDIYSFAPYMFKKHDNPVKEDHGLESPVGDNAYSWFLGKQTLSNMTASLPDTLLFWNEILEHPHYDEYWKERSIEPHLKDVQPAILVVGGEYDTDDCYGALNTYKLIRDNSPDTDLHFVYGPWTHGGWHNADYQGLGDRKFGENLSQYFMEKIEYPFFRYYLEGKGQRPEPVYLFASGSQQWQFMDKWPADDTEYTPLYLSEDRSLSYESPSQLQSSDTYCSDPFTPVPFMADATRRDNSYMVADQSFASTRKDVLTFTSEVIDEIIKLQGPLQVKFDLSLSTEDADIVVKFIDVHPDGYQMLVRGDVFPIRYRYAYDRPVKANPGEILHIDFTMNDIAHWIMPGHRMMVQIQSSWFPLVNINPQTYLHNIYEADSEDYISSEITIYHQKDAQSHIVLPIVR